MAEMTVNTPEIKHVVDDYDFIFHSGMVLPVTINEKAGDAIEFHDSRIVIKIAASPSMNDHDVILPARDIVVYKTHLASYEHRTREVAELAPEQKHAWAQTLKELSKTVQ